MNRGVTTTVGLSIAVALLASTASSAPVAASASAPVTEVEVKAAFLYRFGSFVDWPARSFAGPDDAFVIGVVGAEAVATELRAMVVARTVAGRPVRVEAVAPGQQPSGLQILFVGRDAAAQLHWLVDAVGEAPVLVVSEMPNSLARGGMINFDTVESRVRFDVAPANADEKGLHISAQLLAVARRVIRGPQ